MKIENISKILNRIMIAIFALLIAVGPIFTIFEQKETTIPFALGAIGAVGIIFVLGRLNIKIENKHILKLGIILSVLCFVIKFLWIYFVRITPMVDYETYFNYAKTLSQGFDAPDRYVALFPHIFGYSWFLSFFIKIFGAGPLLAPVINVIFSVISGIMIYRISYKLLNAKAAVFSYLLWIFCPSQTIYNSLVFSDLFYTTMILAFVLIITEINMHEKVKATALLGIVAGLILRLVNITRPIAAVLIIAVFIWLFVLKTSQWKSKKFAIKWTPFVITLVLCYFVTGSLWNSYVTKRLGEEPASVPGYNIMVGFNMNSMGTWNVDDSALLTNYSNQPGATAVWAQEQMMEEAKAHITSGNIDFLKLFKNKLMTFLGTDSTAVFYHNDVLVSSKVFLGIISNIFYYMLVILLLMSLVKLFKHSDRSSISIVILYSIGLILAQMLVEVAGRYHYSIIPMFILICQYGLFFKDKKENSNTLLIKEMEINNENQSINR